MVLVKNCHFSKGVSPCFWSKIDHFSIFLLFRNTGQENVFFDILKRKKCFLAIKEEVQNVEKLPFLQRGYSMVLVKNWQFFHLFF